MSTICESHVHLDEYGVAWVDDSNIKVVEIALERIAHGYSPEEIWEQHQGYLTMAQIHAALSHYFDHQADYDAEIDRQLRDYDALRAAAHDSPGRRRLRQLEKPA
jgi:uncharacterized protein (DUF433 family)